MAIQFLRGSGHSSTSTLAVGQPYYDTANSLLFMGVSSTSTLAELNSITYNASRWLQSGIFNHEEAEWRVGMFFFTDTVLTEDVSDGNDNWIDFLTDHLYESIFTSGIYATGSSSFLSVMLAYVTGTTSTGMRIYYSTNTFSLDFSFTSPNLSYCLITPIAAKKVTSN